MTTTTTDIARLGVTAVATMGNASDALDRLGRWVAAARDAHTLVAPLVNTAFVPDAYKPKVSDRATDKEKAAAYEVAVANATAAVLQGISLGIDPLTALQQIYIVHGRPGMYAKMMVALIQAHGHEVWTEDLSDTRAVVCGRRSGADYVERVTVSMDQARKAGWTSNQAYMKTPQDMLWARAAARVCDRIASDVLKGIASVEQIRDEIQATAEVGNSGHRVVTPRRAALAAVPAVEEPPLDDEPAVDAKPAKKATKRAAPADPLDIQRRMGAVTAAVEMMTKPQSGKMFALLTEQGYGDKDAALAFIAITIGREVASRAELTRAEAGLVIDKLEAMAAPDEPPLDDADWPDAAQPPTDPEVTG